MYIVNTVRENFEANNLYNYWMFVGIGVSLIFTLVSILVYKNRDTESITCLVLEILVLGLLLTIKQPEGDVNAFEIYSSIFMFAFTFSTGVLLESSRDCYRMLL